MEWRQFYQQAILEQLDIDVQKKKTLKFPWNLTQIDHRPKYRTENHNIPRR